MKIVNISQRTTLLRVYINYVIYQLIIPGIHLMSVAQKFTKALPMIPQQKINMRSPLIVSTAMVCDVNLHVPLSRAG